MKKKNNFTLLELMIAITLTAIILSALSYFYKQLSWINSEANQTQAKSFQMRFLESRLADILPKAVSEKTDKKDFFFFTTPDTQGLFKNNSPSLIFTFDNGVDLDKEFANHVLARIYLDKNGSLYLAMWPSPKLWSEQGLPPMKKQVLMENVDAVQFRFFIPPAKEEIDDKNQLKKTPLPPLTWTDTWIKDYKQLPAIVSVIIKKGNETETFSFPLPNVDQPIVYSR